MLKSVALAFALTVSSSAICTPALAQPSPATSTVAPVDSARLKLAEQTVAKLIPPGTYQKIMKDMVNTMAGGIVDQMMGMDAATIAGMAGEGKDSISAKAAEGKTMADIVAEKDPNFKERMDITMKVMFSEMGELMSAMEPTVREAMAKIYARKYTARELTDMNSFFATPSGAAFAGNFMASFTDKEMIDASFGMMPKIMEAMPTIMKKIEAATAHLPPIPKSEEQAAIDTALDEAAAAIIEASSDVASKETGEEPWYAEDNWLPAMRSKADKLSDAYMKASAKSDAAYSSYDEAQVDAINDARKRFLADGWKPEPSAPVMAAEEIPDNAVPPPAAPK